MLARSGSRPCTGPAYPRERNVRGEAKRSRWTATLRQGVRLAESGPHRQRAGTYNSGWRAQGWDFGLWTDDHSRACAYQLQSKTEVQPPAGSNVPRKPRRTSSEDAASPFCAGQSSCTRACSLGLPTLSSSKRSDFDRQGARRAEILAHASHVSACVAYERQRAVESGPNVFSAASS
jgi:hypothetical protein